MDNVATFPKRPVPAHLGTLSEYDREAARRGVTTMTIEAASEAHHEKERLRAIAQMPEMAAFGPAANPFSAYLMFEAMLSAAEAWATVVAVRAALTEIGIAGFGPLIEGEGSA